MTTINQHGWEFLLPHDVVVVWDGQLSSANHHVKIIEGKEDKNGLTIVDTGTGNGTVTFNLNATIETDKDHYSILMGSPNYFVEGAKPMNALVRTDWYSHNPLQFCWKMTEPNKEVVFKKDTPFMFLMPYPKNLINETNFYIKTMDQNIKDRVKDYTDERRKFYATCKPFEWGNMYKNGRDRLDETSNKYLDKVFRPTPKKPIVVENTGEQDA